MALRASMVPRPSDAGGLPSADLGVQHRPHRVDGDVVEDLVVDGFAADDAVLSTDRLGPVEISDGGVVEAAGADLRRDGGGDAVEVGMAVEPCAHVPPGPFAFEVVVDAFAHEARVGHSGVFAVCFHEAIWTMAAFDLRSTGRVLGLIFGSGCRGWPSRWRRRVVATQCVVCFQIGGPRCSTCGWPDRS